MKKLYSIFNDHAILLWVAGSCFLIGSGINHPAHAQTSYVWDTPLEKKVIQAMKTLKADELLEHAKVISDKKYIGREAGKTGSRHASQYIVENFQKAGLRPGGSAGTFFQRFKIEVGYKIHSTLQVTISGNPVENFQRRVDYALVHLVENRANFRAELAFVGYGISRPDIGFDEYQEIDVREKAVLVFAGVPWKQQFSQWGDRSTPQNVKYQSLLYKAQNAARHGAKCLLVVDDPLGWRNKLETEHLLRNPDTNSPLNSPIPILHVSYSFINAVTYLDEDSLQEIAEDISQEKQPESRVLQGRELELKADIQGKAWVGRNIIGVLPGSHPDLKREAVVIGAHYDHLGTDNNDIYFGANDNSAGVAALLGVAKAFHALEQKPARTVIFAAFDAEEIGKKGSKHFIEYSPIPILQTVLMVNFDMIGKNEPNSIFAVGTRSSFELHQIHQKVNEYVGLALVHPKSYRLGRSDHSPFYKAGVPIMYLFGGLDKDYNTPQDTWEKLIPEKIEKVSRLAFLTTHVVAKIPFRIGFDGYNKNEDAFLPN
ncbi:MAG: M20/M25/M40 family metallo-hydrolase [SAR324 cluster bacterium]|nr:M20/M25/M40 family metallo-hydrolase [SAR324 cluster bacterium]